MKKIKLFYLENCPYCHYARKALTELAEERKEYGEIEVEWIEESKHPEIADQYAYYYVPTIFYEERKLYEASPKEDYAACKKNVKAALDVVCSMWCLEEDR